MTKEIEKYNKPENKSSEYIEYMVYLDVVLSLLGGTLEMRKKGEVYLPKNYGEDSDDYSKRLQKSFLLNVFKRTLQKLTGQVFSEKIYFSDSEDFNVDEQLKNFIENVDDNGSTITQFCENVFFNGLAKGVSHILVDFPEINTTITENGIVQYLDKETNEYKPLTKEAVRINNWRPFWNEIKSEDIIGWRSTKENGKTVLTQVRIKESVTVPVGKFGSKVIHQIKVLEIGSYETYVKIDDEDSYLLDVDKSGKTSLDYIPLFTFIAGEPLSILTAKPALEDLAWLNIEHWQSSSSQRNILHHAREVTYFGKMLDTVTVGEGYDEEREILIGHNRMITSSEPDGDLKVVEHTGAAIEAGKNDLDSIKQEMSMFGLTYLMPKTGNITATAKAIDTSENDSVLLSQARQFEEVINQCKDATAEYLMIDDKKRMGKLIVNKEFENLLDDFSIDILIKAGVSGILPKQLIIQELKNRKAITTDDDIESIMAMISNETSLSGALSGIKGVIKPDKTIKNN